MSPFTELTHGRSPKRKKSKKRSVTPSRKLYNDFPQAYRRIKTGISGENCELGKMPSPSPGQDALDNPFQNLNPSCIDLPKVPHHMIRPGPLSPVAAEQIFNRASNDDEAASEEDGGDRPFSALLPPPVAEVSPPPSMRTPYSSQTSRARNDSSVSRPPTVRWDRPCGEQLLEIKETPLARSPSLQAVNRTSAVSGVDSQAWESIDDRSDDDLSFHSEPQESLRIGRTESGSSIADISSDGTSILSADKTDIATAGQVPVIPWDPLAITRTSCGLADSSIPALPAPVMVKAARRSSSFGQYHHPLLLPASHVHPLESVKITAKPSFNNPFADPACEDNNTDSPRDAVNNSVADNESPQLRPSPLSDNLSQPSKQSSQNPSSPGLYTPRTLRHVRETLPSKAISEGVSTSVSPMTSSSAARPVDNPPRLLIHKRTATQDTSWYMMQVQAAGTFGSPSSYADSSSMVTVDINGNDNSTAAAVTCPCFRAKTQDGRPINVSPGDIEMGYIVTYQSAYCPLHRRREFPFSPTLYLERARPAGDTTVSLQHKTGKRLIRLFALIPVFGWVLVAFVANDHRGTDAIIHWATNGEVSRWHERERKLAKKYTMWLSCFYLCLFFALVVCAICFSLLRFWEPSG